MVLDFRFWIEGKRTDRLLISMNHQRSTINPFRISSFGFRISDFEFRISSFGFRVSDFEFRISDFGFRISDFGFRISDFEFRVSSFGFRISDFRSGFCSCHRRFFRDNSAVGSRHAA